MTSTHQRIIIGRLCAIHRTWRTDIMIRSIEFLRDRWRMYCELEGGFQLETIVTGDNHHDVALASYFTLHGLHLPAVLV